MFYRKLLVTAVSLHSLALTAWLLLRLLRGESSVSVALMNAVGVWWFVPLLVLLPIALLIRARQALIISLIFVLLALFFFGPDWRAQEAAADNAAQLRVLSFNALFKNESYEAVEALIREHQPDLIAIQELSPEMAHQLKVRLGEEYPHQLLYPRSDPRGIGIWSRHPLTEGPSRNIDWWDNWVHSAIVHVEGQAIQLFNVHLYPFHGSSRHLMAQRLGRQHLQAQQLRDLVSEVDIPVLVVGDFNMSPTNESYTILNELLDDAWRQVAIGPGFTYPAPGSVIPWTPAFLRIDYFWIRGAIAPLDIQVLNQAGSDHLPLLGEFVVPTQ